VEGVQRLLLHCMIDDAVSRLVEGLGEEGNGLPGQDGALGLGLKGPLDEGFVEDG